MQVSDRAPKPPGTYIHRQGRWSGRWKKHGLEPVWRCSLEGQPPITEEQLGAVQDEWRR